MESGDSETNTNYLTCLKLLLEIDYNPNRANKEWTDTLLIWSLKEQNKEMTELLLNNQFIDVNEIVLDSTWKTA